MNKTKFTTFILVIFGLGLAQFWIVTLIFWYKELGITTSLYFGEGNLFFFSTSLVYSSAYLLYKNNRSYGRDRNYTIIAVSLVSALAIIGYTSEMVTATEQVRSPLFLGRYGIGQIACFLLAAIFSIYSQIRSYSLEKYKYVTL